MPKRLDLQRILVIGSGPIVIGQACEFDYSGTQALKALKAEGYEAVLLNSNPATIMTDPELARRTYIEPLTLPYLERVLAAERPDAVLPTVGGQTALNLALQAYDAGLLESYGVEMLGASAAAIRTAEDREVFRTAVEALGLEVPRSRIVDSVAAAQAFAQDRGFPIVVRPSFTLGGSGGGLVYNAEECETVVRRGLELSPVNQVLVEQSVVGWKEFELEVIRDSYDNAVVVCSIENIDAMGVHTGDSMTVAPAQTLTDVEYQRLRDAALAILRKVKVDTGGSNVQFALNPQDGRLMVIEMNPRVSRSSALASKATGYPIAKVATKLAVGYALDEIPNDITRETPAAFEPSLDYVVTKIPKFAFEKFSGADPALGTQMKSVGEVMAIGRTFRESLFKALRSLEALRPYRPEGMGDDDIRRGLSTPNENRLRLLVYALEAGWELDELHRLTHFDPWFLDQIQQFAELQRQLRTQPFEQLDPATLRDAKRQGFSDRRLGHLTGASAAAARQQRLQQRIRPVFKCVDTCAAEFESYTPYLYSAYEAEDEYPATAGRKVAILGSGPNRIGQGIEFDYCCCHAAFTLARAGVESIMINCNPETVSTDYDTSDRLYFEPLTFEDVMEVLDREQPEGVVVQFGGQTPLNLTEPLAAAGVPILGTKPDAIALAEDRERFCALLDRLGVAYPEHRFARSLSEARAVGEQMGYPLLVRPSYVLGGRAMGVVYSDEELQRLVNEALQVAPGAAILIDRFLDGAIELDVDALADGESCVIAGIMQHIEEAGVHSGDSACVLPPHGVGDTHLETIRRITHRLAAELDVVGLLNIQFAVHRDGVYVIEVNPRASRTVPFLAKATGVPLAEVATRLMLGERLRDFGLPNELPAPRWFVKAPVFPFRKFPGVDPRLTPEMRSTGEVMGHGESVGEAVYKALTAADMRLPRSGTAFVTVCARDHAAVVPIARRLQAAGFALVATRGTAASLRDAGLAVRELRKRSEGRPDCVDSIRSGEIDLIINTAVGAESHRDGYAIRTAAVDHGVPILTTLSGAEAAVEALLTVGDEAPRVMPLQDVHPGGGRLR